MSGQVFYASRDSFTWPNGALGYRPGGPFDCLGPFAKVLNCPVHGTALRKAAYATGYADTAFSIPAVCYIGGIRVKGYFTEDESMGGIVFRPLVGKTHI